MYDKSNKIFCQISWNVFIVDLLTTTFIFVAKSSFLCITPVSQGIFSLKKFPKRQLNAVEKAFLFNDVLLNRREFFEVTCNFAVIEDFA